MPMAQDSCLQVEYKSSQVSSNEESWNSRRHGGMPPFVNVRPNRSGASTTLCANGISVTVIPTGNSRCTVSSSMRSVPKNAARIDAAGTWARFGRSSPPLPIARRLDAIELPRLAWSSPAGARRAGAVQLTRRGRDRSIDIK